MNGTLGNQNEPERPIDEVENLKTEKEELGQQLMGVTKELDSVKEKAEQYKQKLQYHADIDDTIKTFKEKWHSSLLSIRKK